MLRYRYGKVEYHTPGNHTQNDDGSWTPHAPGAPEYRHKTIAPDVTKKVEQLGTTAAVNTAPSAFDTGGSALIPHGEPADIGKWLDKTGIGSTLEATAKPAADVSVATPIAPTAYPTPTGISGDPALKTAAAAAPIPSTVSTRTGAGEKDIYGRSLEVNDDWQFLFDQARGYWEGAVSPVVQKRMIGIIETNLRDLDPTKVTVDPVGGIDIATRNLLNEKIQKAIDIDDRVLSGDASRTLGFGPSMLGTGDRPVQNVGFAAGTGGFAAGDVGGLYAVAQEAKEGLKDVKKELPEEARRRMVYLALKEKGFTDAQLSSIEALGGASADVLEGVPSSAAVIPDMPVPQVDAVATGAAEAPKENQYSVFVSQASEGISQHDVNTAQGRAALEDIAAGKVFGKSSKTGARTIDDLQLPPGYSIDEASGFLTAPEPETGFGILPADQEAQLREAVSLRTQARSILSNYRDPAIAERRAERIMGAELTEEGYQLQRDLQAEGNAWQQAQNVEARQLQKDLQSSEIQADKDLQASNATLQKDLLETSQMYDMGKQVQNQAHELNIASMDDTLQRDLAFATNVIAAQRINMEHAWNEGHVGRATQIADNQYQNDMKLIFRRASAEQDTLQKSYELDEHFGRDPRMLIMTEGTQQRLAIGEQGKQNIKLAGVQGQQDRLNISASGTQDRLSIAARGAIDQSLESMRQNGQTGRLGMQIQADELAQGRQITHEEAMQKAELQLKISLQNAQLSHAVSQLDTQGQQALAQLGARGELDTLAQARDIQSREFMAGNQITHESALAQARQAHETIIQTAGITGAGVEERATLREQQTIAREERAELGISTGADAVTMARESTGAYITNLNTAMQNAVAGDYENVDAALAAELPPVPSGVVWSSQTGVFQQRGGFEGREMDAETQRWISAATPAFKARDRAEQALTQARTLQLESDLRIRERRMADEDFRQAMLTADIDTAEEAITRQRMAETQQLEVETKMQNMQMLLSLLQNPVQLGMAKRHGLLGQIETALGFEIGNVPTAPASGQAIPTPEEWQSLDSETQAFRIAAYVEQGGSPDEFMQMIAAGSPGQMQQVQYGVL